MKPPVIGILGIRTPSPKDSPFLRLERDSTNNAYLGAVETAGGIPVLLPVLENLSKAGIATQLSLCDGIIIPGGQDVSPDLYGQANSPLLGRTHRHSDTYHLIALGLAEKAGIPILGICRGIQVINVGHGGTLWQDVSLSPLPSGSIRIEHSHKDSYEQACHTVRLNTSSRLSHLFSNASELKVNSLHHQAVHILGTGLRISAIAPDGIIEGFENTDDTGSWIMAVQWHPEVMVDSTGNPMAVLFDTFIAQAAHHHRD
jgi:putative glutamine amidotransferase